MRVKLLKSERVLLFNRGVIDVESFCTQNKISTKTFSNWEKGNTTIPKLIFNNLMIVVGLDESQIKPIYLDDFWYVLKAAKKGGLAHKKLYGNFGTPEGRRKGGLTSIERHRKNGDNFKNLKHIQLPKDMDKLAELCGILIGDGGMTKYQVIVTTNSVTDIEHAQFVKDLVKDLFDLDAGIYFRKNKKAVNVTISSKNLVDFLFLKGIPIGNKFKRPLHIPKWINKNRKLQKAFTRGLFDTDGSIYLDRHTLKGKTYSYPCVAITSYSVDLLGDLLGLLKNFGLNVTYRNTQKSVYLRGANSVDQFFKIIGTHNYKHLKRYNLFMEEYRSGHNGAVSKTAVA